MEIEDTALIEGLPEVELTLAQDDELLDTLHRLIFHVGGPGSGKSKINVHHFLRRANVCVDQMFFIFANSYDQLHNAIIPEMKEMLQELVIDDRYERPPPRKWRRRWKRLGIVVPKVRNRYHNIWIWENGVHIYTGTLANNAWKRVKSFEFEFGIVEEGFEGAPLTAIKYIFQRVRCGLGKIDRPDGTSECSRRGHHHAMIVKSNVPFDDPNHWSYSYVEQLLAQESDRAVRGERPFFRLIESDTRDNKHLPPDYVDNLRSTMDPETFEIYLSGKLRRNIQATVYHRYSEENDLPSLVYDPTRALHMWFDFNNRPAAAGWGHDLNIDEVPSRFLRANRTYFGIVGEWFSVEPMTTDMLAQALCADPTADTRCNDCMHTMDLHVSMPRGHLCQRCARFCSGEVRPFEWSRKPLHAPANWRGLMAHRGPIYIYADASGGSSAPDSQSPTGGPIGVLRDVLGENLKGRARFRIKSANPSVVTRLLSVNRGLGSADGVRSYFVAPWCTAHRRDFREVVPDKDGKPRKVTPTRDNMKKSDEWMLTHCSDGFGYFSDYRFPAIRRRAHTHASVGTPQGTTSFGAEERHEEDPLAG